MKTRRRSLSTPVTSPRITMVFRCFLRMPRIGEAICPGAQEGSCDLVEERLEEVVVLPVDEDDPRIRLTERLRGGEAAEASSDGHHARRRVRHDGPRWRPAQTTAGRSVGESRADAAGIPAPT
jgi:hypothetical protein